jgi:hypothetical protein
VPEHATLRQSPEPTHCSEAASPRPLSLLELFHPDGAAQRALVIGSNCPEILRPLQCSEITEDVDLVILAPTPAECRASGWLEDAARSVSQRLTADGVAYAVVPPLRRLRIRNLLYGCNLSIDQAILHLPDPGSSRYLIPLSPAPARYAVSNLLSLTFRKRLLATVGLCLIGSSKLFQWSLPSAGLLVRRPGARPMFEWLFRLNSEANGSVLITTSSRGKEGSVAVHFFPGDAEKPSAVAKIKLKPTECLVGEAATHGDLGPSACAAGAQVPRILSLASLNGHPVLLQTALCGHSIGALLASRPNRLLGVLEHLVSWLESWNRSTRTTMPLDVELLEREILAPAVLVAAHLDEGGEYQKWLKTACSALAGAATPLVTTHNDLTMWNLLLRRHGQLGVVDWESARENDLPFVDFFYAVADAVTIARGFTETSKTFEACFVAGGAYERLVRQLLGRLRRVVGVPDEIVELCFHACWLHHAANECRTAKSSDPPRFLKIVQWLVLNRPRVGSWVRA